MIDEFGLLSQQMEAFKPTEERHKQLRAQIAAWWDDQPANQAFLEEGERFTLEISERAHTRTITNMGKLFRMLGQKLFLKLCKFPLAAVDTNVPEVEHKAFLEENQDGSRKLKTVAKAVLQVEQHAA